MSAPENKRPLVGIGILIERNGKILLGERLSKNRGSYQIPGGHLEFGQTIEVCARQEVLEETGLADINIRDMICVNNDIVYDVHYITIGIFATSTMGEPSNPEPDKSRNWRWYDPKDIPTPLFIPSKRVIDAWLSKTFCNEFPHQQ